MIIGGNHAIIAPITEQEVVTMADYKKMYYALFNAVTTAINDLQDAQRDGECEYIEMQDVSLTILPTSTDEKPKTTG
ncbi:hypothetical protein Desmer_0575 [Desulfosporosinus meridiei DSM 13257]|uniref:Uncharacterized protein n=2 Tax=Desulfosporosinus TaxID=79206 RepID=J7ILD9_DESMD|nr:hypothetical protein Desmer_0575 [Desulfosporosinus meridiei DSM 13257]